MPRMKPFRLDVLPDGDAIGKGKDKLPELIRTQRSDPSYDRNISNL